MGIKKKKDTLLDAILALGQLLVTISDVVKDLHLTYWIFT